ncbi:MAG: helix-turn-helix domain-containing protein [Oscillibacter sp.]|nr:helix-turn-helix domain-containing protein [Oscillibacter sp.]
MAEKIGIQVKDKFCLTLEEASHYFGIGEKKLRKLVHDNLDTGFVIQNGVKIRIKRQRLEQFLNALLSI